MDSKYIQITILAAVFGLQYLFEHIYPQQRKINDWKNERFNIGIGLLNIILTLAPAFAMVQWTHFIADKKIGLLNAFAFPVSIKIFFAILMLDVWMYAWHLLNHKLYFLWRFHKFHHKDEKMNSTTALRFHTVELLLSYPGKAMVVFIIGINYSSLLIYEIMFFAAVVIHHSNIFITESADNLYRRLFASPLMHRIHHSKNMIETNSNFGALFSFWDGLFKTQIKKASGEIIFGLTEEDREL